MANKRIDELSAGTVGSTILSADVVEIIHDPAGTPASYKATLLQSLLAANNPAVSTSRTTTQSVATGFGSPTMVAMNVTDDFDTDVMHDTVTNNSRITCKTAGVFIFSADVAFDAAAAGNAYVIFFVNGVSVTGSQNMGNNATAGISIVFTKQIKLAVNDYVEVGVYQTSAGSLNVIGGDVQASRIAIG